MAILKTVAELSTRPLLVASSLAIVGYALRRRGSRWGSSLMALAALLAYASSTLFVGDALLGALERVYPPLQPSAWNDIRHIVVLGASYDPREGIPVTGALDPDGLARIVEGVRIARAVAGARLVVSGGAAPGYVASALGYAELARQLGVPQASLIVMDRALDTRQEAEQVHALLGAEKFILVTSACHMPRAMALMRRAGANPIAAPTAQHVDWVHDWEKHGYLPGSGGLRKTEFALHEYFGLAAMSLGAD
jgi:uncharacterized SAM-binding protein YcdF (DUF218 family)